MKGAPLPPLRTETLVAALKAANAPDGGVTFVDLRENETHYAFPDVRARAETIARALRARGVMPGDRVVLVLPTGIEFMDAFFGALLAGAVPVPLYPPARLVRLEEFRRASVRMVNAAGATIILTDARTYPPFAEVAGEANTPLGCTTVADLRADLGTGASDVSLPDVAPEDLAVIQFSSGSTVDPKPVSLTHGNIVAQCAALEASFPKPAELVTERPVGVSWLPLYHDMGLIGALLTAVYCDGHIVLLSPEHFLLRPALWLRAVSRHRAMVTPAPNFGYAHAERRIKDADLSGVDLSSLRLALNGAEPVSAEVLRRFADRFAKWGFDRRALTPVYGLAEASLAVTFSTPGSAPRSLRVDARHLATTRSYRPGDRELVSVGVPVSGVEVEVRGDDHAPLADGLVGHVCARGPAIMRGYFGDAASTAATLRDGWLDTGDLGFVHEGELYLCGRAKDVVIVRGANHAPQEFEECVEELDGVRDAGVVAVGFTPEGEDGEGLLLLVERASMALGSMDENDPDRLIERIRRNVAERTGILPHTVALLEAGALPRTSSGKLRRREALRRYLADELVSPRKARIAASASEPATTEETAL